MRAICNRRRSVDLVATQTALQGRAGHLGTNELSGDDQQIIQGQQQQATQLHDDGLLGRVEPRAQCVRPMAEIVHALARLPLEHGGLGDVVAPSQFRGGLVRGLDLGANPRGGASLRVDVGQL